MVGVDDLSGGYLDNVNKDCIFFKENLVDDNLTYIFRKFDIEKVFHFAAYAAEGLSPFMRQYNYKNNLVATAKLINHAIDYLGPLIVLRFAILILNNVLYSLIVSIDTQA